APQHLYPRRESLPVLRPQVLLLRAVARSRDPALARRRLLLGERGLRVSGLQREERQPHTPRGLDEANRPAQKASLASRRPFRREPIPSRVAELSGPGALEYGLEVSIQGSVFSWQFSYVGSELITD